MKTLHSLGLALLALSFPLVAQEVIILGEDLPAASAPRRSPENRSGANSISAQILVADGRSGGMRAAAPDSIFYDEQRFRLRVSGATEGHLYVLCLNSQGNANVVFPTLDTGAMGGLVGRRGPITIPDSGWFQFDSEPGVERLFLLLSTRPINDLERAIDEGGEISSELLQRYATGRTSSRENARAKGVLTYTGSDILVRKLELLHEGRY